MALNGGSYYLIKITQSFLPFGRCHKKIQFWTADTEAVQSFKQY